MTKLRIILMAAVILFLSDITDTYAQYQSIVMSSRWFHPVDSKDPYRTLSAFKDYKADRIDWMYNDNINQLNLLQKANIKYSLTLNPQIPDSNGYSTVKTRIIDINGKPCVAPWMVNWISKNPYWGCVNNPKFKKVFVDKGKQIVDLGAYGIMVDDARFNDHAAEWGGCFCKYCIEGFRGFLQQQNILVKSDFNFRKYLKSHPQDKYYTSLYKSFQKQSVVNFLKSWKLSIRKYSNNSISFLTNNGGGKWDEIYQVFDIGIAEIMTERTSFDQLHSTIILSEKLGKKQVFSYASANSDLNISYYLYCYLNNTEALIPWDLWLNDPVNRNARLYTPVSDIVKVIDFIKKYGFEFKGLLNAGLYTKNLAVNPKFSKILKTRDGHEYLILLNDSKENLINTAPLNSSFVPIISGTKVGNSYKGFVILQKII